MKAILNLIFIKNINATIFFTVYMILVGGNQKEVAVQYSLICYLLVTIAQILVTFSNYGLGQFYKLRAFKNIIVMGTAGLSAYYNTFSYFAYGTVFYYAAICLANYYLRYRKQNFVVLFEPNLANEIVQMFHNISDPTRSTVSMLKTANDMYLRMTLTDALLYIIYLPLASVYELETYYVLCICLLSPVIRWYMILNLTNTIFKTYNEHQVLGPVGKVNPTKQAFLTTQDTLNRMKDLRNNTVAVSHLIEEEVDDYQRQLSQVKQQVTQRLFQLQQQEDLDNTSGNNKNSNSNNSNNFDHSSSNISNNNTAIDNKHATNATNTANAVSNVPVTDNTTIVDSDNASDTSTNKQVQSHRTPDLLTEEAQNHSIESGETTGAFALAMPTDAKLLQLQATKSQLESLLQTSKAEHQKFISHIELIDKSIEQFLAEVHSLLKKKIVSEEVYGALKYRVAALKHEKETVKEKEQRLAKFVSTDANQVASIQENATLEDTAITSKASSKSHSNKTQQSATSSTDATSNTTDDITNDSVKDPLEAIDKIASQLGQISSTRAIEICETITAQTKDVLEDLKGNLLQTTSLDTKSKEQLASTPEVDTSLATVANTNEADLAIDVTNAHKHDSNDKSVSNQPTVDTSLIDINIDKQVSSQKSQLVDEIEVNLRELETQAKAFKAQFSTKKSQ